MWDVFLFTRSVVRLAASLLTKLVDSLAPSITSVLVHGKQVSGNQNQEVKEPSLNIHSGRIFNMCIKKKKHFNVHWSFVCCSCMYFSLNLQNCMFHVKSLTVSTLLTQLITPLMLLIYCSG